MLSDSNANSDDLAQALAVAERAARAGGDVVMHYFREGVTMRQKFAGEQSFNLVSDADVHAERAIVALIKEAFPQHVVLGEEEHRADPNSEHVWIIDPLDGTNNFAHRLPHFSVSIAYCQRGRAVCGVVFDPVRGHCYTAAEGRGSFMNGQRVGVADHTQLNETLVGVGFYYDRGMIMEATLAAIADLFRAHIHGIRRIGSAALDLCYVGQGIFGAFFEYNLAPWDFAAGQLFVKEAGGQVSDCHGQPLPLAKSGVLATNGRLHGAMLRVVAARAPRA